jgi:hypothetical protein
MTRKDTLMLLGIAGVLAAGTACAGMFTKKDDTAASTVPACAGLEGQAKIDCERQQQKP